MGSTGAEREQSEYADLVRKLEAAQESDAIEQTYCMRMLNGEIPNIVPNTRAPGPARPRRFTSG